MMTATTKLDSALQALVDDRLDAIDRVLQHAGMSRSERRGIVEEVEAQIFELLGRRVEGEPTRAEVVAVLDSLDPPEAYAPESYRRRFELRDPYDEVRRRVPQPSLLALASALGGLFVLILVVLAYSLLASNGGEMALLLATFVLFAGAGVSVCGFLSIRQIRESGGWLTGLPVALFGALLFPLLMFNGLLLMALVFTAEISLYVFTGLAVVAANAYLVAHAWWWVSADYRPARPRSRGE